MNRSQTQHQPCKANTTFVTQCHIHVLPSYRMPLMSRYETDSPWKRVAEIDAPIRGPVNLSASPILMSPVREDWRAVEQNQRFKNALFCIEK